MRILALSDTHGEASNLAWLIKKLGPSVSMAIHCGDGVLDFSSLPPGSAIPPLVAVRGNGDSSSLPLFRVVEALGKRVLVVHGHAYGVYDTRGRLAEAAMDFKCCLALYGHTHVPAREDFPGLVIANPGSLSRPRSIIGPSFALIDIEEGADIVLSFFRIEGQGGRRVSQAFEPR